VIRVSSLTGSPVNDWVQVTGGAERTGEDVCPRRSGEIEHPEQLELVGHVLRTPNLGGGDVERVELAEAGRLDLYQPLGLVRVVVAEHVPQPVPDLVRHPPHPRGQIVAARRAKPVPLKAYSSF